ncbi:exosome complex component RRP42 [Culicoides brevitarsis]|uniref:exosome complex component RRP42 n=1 Tax=Culicoides brevitarsis TaxID=469753 RepID=UPI00307CA919
MANIHLSEAEKVFILHGIRENLRCDGRKRSDYRPMEIETDIVLNSNGSARLRLANSDVMASIKAEIDQPHASRPNEGKVEFFVDCSANATPEFEGRGGEELALEISNTMSKAFSSPNTFDLKTLCILPRTYCWKLYIDILILECGGNLFDAVSIAVKAALFDTKIPNVTPVELDKGNTELVLSDDIYDCSRLDVTKVPLLVTLCKVGDDCIIDPTAEEEECKIASLVVGVCCQSETEATIATIRTSGTGSISQETLSKQLKMSLNGALCVNKLLMETLKRCEELPEDHTVGFLK